MAFRVFQLDGWARLQNFNYTLYPITFPPENAAEWKKLFKPCASQRLFLPVSAPCPPQRWLCLCQGWLAAESVPMGTVVVVPAEPVRAGVKP